MYSVHVLEATRFKRECEYPYAAEWFDGLMQYNFPYTLTLALSLYIDV